MTNSLSTKLKMGGPVVKFQTIIMALILSLCFFITLTPCSFADDNQKYIENTSYLLRIFEGKYLDISDRVSRGELPADVLAKANEIRAQLKKTVIKHNAEMEMLKVDILDGPKEKGAAAFDSIQILMNETEQNKVHYLQKLTQLIYSKTSEDASKTSKETSAVMPSKEVPSADYYETGTTSKQVVTVIKKTEIPWLNTDREKVWESKDYDLRMTLDPADNTKGDLD